ncbi:MAG: hypothetical protein WD055_01835 [Candidatus Dependentiae bacterium]
MRRLPFIIICSVMSALLFFSLQKEWIIIQRPIPTTEATTTKTEQKEYILYWSAHALQQETKTIIWTDNMQKNLHYVLNSWLMYLYEEGLHKKLHIETAMLNRSETELFISFDRQPFGKQQSIQQKTDFIQSLLKTVAQCCSVSKVRFLLRHKQFHDPHLDFSHSWPTNLF